MAFPSESSADPFGGAPSYLHQLRKGSEPILNPSPSAASGGKKIQHYGETTLIPTPLYKTVMKTMKEHLENLEANLSLKHLQMARHNVNNPNLYKYHMSEAERYHNVAQSKNINGLIRNKMGDAHTERLEAEIKRLQHGSLQNPGVMAKIRRLQIDLNNRRDILHQKETQSYNQYM